MSERYTQHLEYLHRVSTGDNPAITPAMAERARLAMEAILAATKKCMPVPAISTGSDGEMFYSWDRERHHLELEIIPDQPNEWFYLNRGIAHGFWLEEWTENEPLPSKVVGALELFCTSCSTSRS